ALRRIEAKKLRTRRLIALVAVSTRIMSRQNDVFLLSLCLCDFLCASVPLWFILFHGDDQISFPQRQRLLHRLRQPGPCFWLVFQPVDNDLDVVLDTAVEL